MESKNKLTMCRLCLCENEFFINIYEMNDCQGYVAAEVISDLLQCQVTETDCYPHVVCSTCHTKLTEFKLFKECCQKSKETYEKMFILSDGLVMHQPEMDSGEGGSGFGLLEQVPLKEAITDSIIKEEELDIDSSCNESDKRFEESNAEVSYRPILLKHEVLPFNRDIHTQEEEGQKGTAPEEEIAGRKGKFECHCCRKLLMTKRSLRQHLASHGIGNFFKCDVCGRICGSKSQLVRHTRLHTGEKPYKCTDCSALFRNNSNLKGHMRIHTNIKPYKCKECKLSFNNSSNLKSHMRLHSNLKPHSCEMCHAAFRHKSNLTKHMRTHSGDRPYKCTLCSKAFSQSSTLRNHQVVHSEEKPYPCPHCNKRFNWKGNLKTHLKKVCVWRNARE